MIMVIDQEEFDSFSTDVSYAFLFTHIQIINEIYALQVITKET